MPLRGIAVLACVVCHLSSRHPGKLARPESKSATAWRSSARFRELTSAKVADEAPKFGVAEQQFATHRDQFIPLLLLQREAGRDLLQEEFSRRR